MMWLFHRPGALANRIERIGFSHETILVVKQTTWHKRKRNVEMGNRDKYLPFNNRRRLNIQWIVVLNGRDYIHRQRINGDHVSNGSGFEGFGR